MIYFNFFFLDAKLDVTKSLYPSPAHPGLITWVQFVCSNKQNEAYKLPSQTHTCSKIYSIPRLANFKKLYSNKSSQMIWVLINHQRKCAAGLHLSSATLQWQILIPRRNHCNYSASHLWQHQSRKNFPNW